ncbi:MAG TPA: glutamine-hydrolyzing GMP synthase subunit GuaA, partial [Candidatus Poseidoniales archaeon]|nr:glutamine-hydrolyzing GMP synthase subunit GuaA [Candidatus Poseidoniales archaeon]
MGFFDPTGFAQEAVTAIEKQVQGRAIIAASGGVDSMAAAVLASQAL